MAIVCTFTNSQAQEFFSDKRPVQTEAEFTRKVNDISYDIDVIIKTNKDQLKEELNKIEKQVENNQITKEEADKLRKEKAEYYAVQIEAQTKQQEDRIKKLINNKIEDNINFSSDMSAYQQKLIENKSLTLVNYSGGNSSLWSSNQLNKDNFESGLLSFVELGLGVKTRVGQPKSRYYWKSTLDVSFHFFKIKGNQTFESHNNETFLVDVDFPLTRSAMNLVDFRLSNYIEYDFSKNKYDEFGNQIIKSRQSFYVGAGGFLGYSSLSKQLQYKKDGERFTQTTFSKHNANQFIYGIGAYVGYQNFTIKATYNLNTVFKNSFDQNIFSIGIGVDLF